MADRDTPASDPSDEPHRPRPGEQAFDRVVERALSRRGFLGGVLAFGSAAGALGAELLSGVPEDSRGASRFPFTPIPAMTDGTVHVPEGYRWRVLVRWGDPLFDGVEGAFDHETGGSVHASQRVFGENTDGMESFSYRGHQLLAINHEYPNLATNLPQAEDGVPGSAEDVLKLQNLQGVSVVELAESADGWRVVTGSAFNRRITQNTPMQFVGPAAGHALLRTDADPTGTGCLGTLGNCGSGRTPWGTYLTCEENFNDYFGSTAQPPDQTGTQPAKGYERYGIEAGGWGYDYHKWDPRFDTARHPNEPHRFGWVVEIDPTRPGSAPIKHTGLGRFKHENAEVALARDGRVVVYMGDDERGEFLYKFVSRGTYAPGGSTEGLLDDGTLYAARFNDDQTGEWLALTPEATGMELPELLVFARAAGSAVGATTMDRPEWIATNPRAPEAYCCLTNNYNRGVRPNAGGDETPVNAPNPRAVNHYGQIVRWFPHDGDHGSTRFDWDLYVMAGNPTVHDDSYAGSPNITPGNMFNAPDGIAIDRNGLVWIQTDGDDGNAGDFAGMGNNQMLVGNPATGEIARFLTGPKGCEVTGLTWSADRRTLFVGIQHPGGDWPDGGPLPRSAVIAVKRDDNGIIG
mgnify:FL=1